MASIGSRITRRAVSLAAIVPFLVAMGPDLFGVHGCPYHGHAYAETDTVPGHIGGPPTHHEVSPEERPCTWLVDCHARSGHWLPGPSLSSLLPPYLPDTAAEIPPYDTGPLGPRHGLFELHLPNAPPKVV